MKMSSSKYFPVSGLTIPASLRASVKIFSPCECGWERQRKILMSDRGVWDRETERQFRSREGQQHEEKRENEDLQKEEWRSCSNEQSLSVRILFETKNILNLLDNSRRILGSREGQGMAILVQKERQ